MNIYSKGLPTIKQLQYFVAVCEAKSFRGAAEKLGVSQPPLSIQIRDLEEKLEQTLFLRNSHKVVLTKEGEDFKIKATFLLNELCSTVRSIKSSNIEKVIFGTTKTLCFDFIPYFDMFFSNFCDEIEIYKHNYTSKELLFELKKENIDFALVSDYQTGEQIENNLLVYKEPMILVLPNSHKCSEQEKVDLNDVTDLPLFWFKPYLNPIFHKQCELVFKTLNLPLIRRPELPDNLSMLLEVSLGKAMMLLPQSMTQAKVDGVVYKKLINSQSMKLSINIYLVWQKNLKKNAINQAIIDYFENE
ncbi:LysR family transcriptional regulator [Gilliamella sp. B14448G11]|uniref:LysR family transcriptional regulator n=1 Tax=unclassified Gilliamella TaxID=2685620 RepID=UPI0018DC3B39|nr:LysR family transcriptional regulator [Gilliamella sp. B14448G11]MBI0028710.1 LysR family transcriptional regulator [Gilliamella sp. B14448G7]MBI0031629.1 LysR family transcriptional regulator [Gilliamella sp. B14384G15]MBI0042570.1 LysR family transcriptional regulator [Gilliamella sp. B14448G12]MBI0058984.1 LysR family transcriptional regulator [Gilliamella sp. B14384G12]MBI0035397.1 LysR family transcriptional regulator [Gilliamella sp. B14448G11]